MQHAHAVASPHISAGPALGNCHLALGLRQAHLALEVQPHLDFLVDTLSLCDEVHNERRLRCLALVVTQGLLAPRHLLLAHLSRATRSPSDIAGMRDHPSFPAPTCPPLESHRLAAPRQPPPCAHR
jgi:hypothetical protein